LCDAGRLARFCRALVDEAGLTVVGVGFSEVTAYRVLVSTMRGHLTPEGKLTMKVGSAFDQ